jgi:hypothetical protein
MTPGTEFLLELLRSGDDRWLPRVWLISHPRVPRKKGRTEKSVRPWRRRKRGSLRIRHAMRLNQQVTRCGTNALWIILTEPGRSKPVAMSPGSGTARRPPAGGAVRGNQPRSMIRVVFAYHLAANATATPSLKRGPCHTGFRVGRDSGNASSSGKTSISSVCGLVRGFCGSPRAACYVGKASGRCKACGHSRPPPTRGPLRSPRRYKPLPRPRRLRCR